MKRLGNYLKLNPETGEEILDYSVELPDDTPIEVPLDYKRPPSLEDRIRMFMRSEQFRQEAEKQGFETFEEADDFDIDDESVDDPTSGYETREMALEPEPQKPIPTAKQEPAPPKADPAPPTGAATDSAQP